MPWHKYQEFKVLISKEFCTIDYRILMMFDDKVSPEDSSD
jgi:hypothetical protein